MAQSLKLYYAAGACSMAPHFVLQELGVRFEPVKVDFASNQQRTPEYLKINPRGRVPALAVGERVVTENTSILPYLARLDPAKKLLPLDDSLALARCLSFLGFLSSSVHVSYTHLFRPGRFASDESTHANIKETCRAMLLGQLADVDGLLAGREYFDGGQYTVCDAYLTVFYLWGKRLNLPMADFKDYSAVANRVLARPATRAVLEREGVKP